MNVAAFYQKWMTDIKYGKISAVVPYVGMDMVYKNTGGFVGWGDAEVIIPYRFWKRYGDMSFINDYYEVMRKYAMYMIHNTGMKDKKKAKDNKYNKYIYEKGCW